MSEHQEHQEHEQVSVPADAPDQAADVSGDFPVGADTGAEVTDEDQGDEGEEEQGETAGGDDSGNAS